MQVEKERPASGHVFRVKREKGDVWFAKYRLPDGRQVKKRINANKRTLTYLEAFSHEPGRIDELTAEIVRASRSLEAADRRLTRRLADALPASERDEFWRDHRERRTAVGRVRPADRPTAVLSR